MLRDQDADSYSRTIVFSKSDRVTKGGSGYRKVRASGARGPVDRAFLNGSADASTFPVVSPTVPRAALPAGVAFRGNLRAWIAAAKRGASIRPELGGTEPFTDSLLPVRAMLPRTRHDSSRIAEATSASSRRRSTAEHANNRRLKGSLGERLRVANRVTEHEDVNKAWKMIGRDAT